MYSICNDDSFVILSAQSYFTYFILIYNVELANHYVHVSYLFFLSKQFL